MSPAQLVVRVTPRAGRDAIEGWATDAAGRAHLKVKVRAPASEGAANAAVLSVLAKALGVRIGALKIVSGAAARMKRVAVEGVEPDQIALAFGASPSQD